MKGKYYIFVAQGDGIGSALGMAQGFISVGGVKNADAWKEQIMDAYPGSRNMDVVMIENQEWEHPEVGFLNKETAIDFDQYLRAIKRHLVEKIGLSTGHADEIAATIMSKNICIADYWSGALRFGAPVANEKKAQQVTAHQAQQVAAQHAHQQPMMHQQQNGSEKLPEHCIKCGKATKNAYEYYIADILHTNTERAVYGNEEHVTTTTIYGGFEKHTDYFCSRHQLWDIFALLICGAVCFLIAYLFFDGTQGKDAWNEFIRICAIIILAAGGVSFWIATFFTARSMICDKKMRFWSGKLFGFLGTKPGKTYFTPSGYEELKRKNMF